MDTKNRPRVALRLLRDQAGQAMLEAVIVLFVLVGLLVTVMLFGRIGTAHQQVCFAARRAAFGSEPKASAALQLPTMPPTSPPLPPSPPKEYPDGSVTVDLHETWAGKATAFDLTKAIFGEEKGDRKYSGVVFLHFYASAGRGYALLRKDRTVTAWEPIVGRMLSSGRGFLSRLTVTPKSEYVASCDAWQFDGGADMLATGLYAFHGMWSSYKDCPLEDEEEGFFSRDLLLLPEFPQVDIHRLINELYDQLVDQAKQFGKEVIERLITNALNYVPGLGWLSGPIVGALDPYVDGFINTVFGLLKLS